MSDNKPEKGSGRERFVSVMLGLVLAGAIAGLVYMVMQPVGDTDIDTAEDVAKVTLQAAAPTAEEMEYQTSFSVGG